MLDKWGWFKSKYPQPFHLWKKEELQWLLNQSSSEVDKYLAHSPYVKELEIQSFEKGLGPQKPSSKHTGTSKSQDKTSKGHKRNKK